MELELGLALPNPHQPPLAAGGELFGLVDGTAGACRKKRVFGDAFGAAKATLLPLFVPEDGGDGGGGDDDGVDHDPSNKKKRLVGWPPVKCGRRRSCVGGYVKVNMEGVTIGRKVDVSLHGSYQELLRTLERMFPSANQQGALPFAWRAGRRRPAVPTVTPSATVDQQLAPTRAVAVGAGADADRAEEEEVGSHERRRRHRYVVTYEDGEGDWLLVGDDVPWEVFVKSVKRLKILA